MTKKLLQMYALRALDKDGKRFGGILVPFTGPHLRDSFKQFFSSKTDFGLEKTGPNRPINYHHELGHIRRDIGSFMLIEPRKEGLWAEVELDTENPVYPFVRAEIEAGKLGFSAETMPNWFEYDKATGHVTRFWIVGAALTPKPSAPKGLTTVGALRAFGLEEIEGDETLEVETSVRSVWDFPIEQPADTPNKSGRTSYADLPEANRQPRMNLPAPNLRSVPGWGSSVPVGQGQISLSSDPLDLFDVRDLVMWYQVNKKANPFNLQQSLPENFLRAVFERFVRELQADYQQPIEKSTWLRADPIANTPGDLDWFANKLGKPGAGWLRADELMQSDVSSYGDEWVFTAWETIVWHDIRLASRVLAQLPMFNMPSNPFDYPTIGAGPTIRRVSEAANMTALNWGASSFPVTRLTTAKKTFSVPDKFGAAIMWTEELTRYSQVDKVGAFRQEFVDALARAADRLILHGDETATNQNISHYGTDPTGTNYDYQLLVDGLRHEVLVTTTSNALDKAGAGWVPNDVISLRQKMGVLGVDPSALVQFVDVDLYYDMLGAEELLTVDKYGDLATIRTGEVGKVHGVAIVPSSEMEKCNADGQLEDSHDTTKSNALQINPAAIKVGKLLEQTMDVEKVTAGPGYVMWGYMGFDVQVFQTDAVVYEYDIA